MNEVKSRRNSVIEREGKRKSPKEKMLIKQERGKRKEI